MKAFCTLGNFSLLFFAVAVTLLTGCATGPSFSSPHEAVDSLVQALRTGDSAKIRNIVGPEGAAIIASGDAVADKNDIKSFLSNYDQDHIYQLNADGSATLLVGPTLWPMPVPLVRNPMNNSWSFDIAAGKDELLSRRIGRNELNATQVALAYVDAQRDYAKMDPEKLGKPIYAQRIVSEAGKKNGLYWPTKEGEPQSPLGAGFAAAAREGYAFTSGKLAPYHGYYYRILKARGAAAPGGAADYLVDGKLKKGFALIAWPAEYGASGIASFMVDQFGVVYSTDLGPDTEKVARDVTAFNPDAAWRPVKNVPVVINSP